MAKKILENQKDKVLNLGSLHDEVEKEEHKDKIKKLPIILLSIGIFLILVGSFYKNIINFIVDKTGLFTKEEEKTASDKNILKCNKKYDDFTTGISNEVITTYYFTDNNLKKVKIKTTSKPLQNSYEIGSSNLAIYHQQDLEILKSLETVQGLDIKLTFENSILTITSNIDYQSLNKELFPQNGLINISNRLNQSYREIKEIEGRAGNICNTK